MADKSDHTSHSILQQRHFSGIVERVSKLTPLKKKLFI
jgi:hypothetical protein